MDKLKPRYKLLVGLLSLIVCSPIFIMGINNKEITDLVINNNLIISAAKSYDIDLCVSLKSQENGLIFGAIFLILLIIAFLIIMFFALIIVALTLKIIKGWSIPYTFSILLKGSYPKEWLK